MAKKKPRSETVASASQGKSKRQTRMADQSIVAAYLSKLEAALGNAEAFPVVFETLKADTAVQQAEAVELASLFVAKTAASTSRLKALERIWKRHSAVASFKLKQRAMAGRSAA